MNMFFRQCACFGRYLPSILNSFEVYSIVRPCSGPGANPILQNPGGESLIYIWSSGLVEDGEREKLDDSALTMLVYVGALLGRLVGLYSPFIFSKGFGILAVNVSWEMLLDTHRLL